jgi:hypothetical protein
MLKSFAGIKTRHRKPYETSSTKKRIQRKVNNALIVSEAVQQVRGT